MIPKVKIILNQKTIRARNLRLVMTRMTPKANLMVMPMTLGGWMIWTSFAHLLEINDENNY